MSMTRKRKKQLKRLKGDANALWAAQQDLLDQANSVARDASRQLSAYSRDEIAPRLARAYEDKLQPVVHRVDAATYDARQVAKHNFDKKVLPAMGGALGTVMALGDAARDGRVKAAFGKVAQPAPKKKSGAGRAIALTAGLVAAAGVAYAVWQTFRADDELWVADDDDSLPGN
ncbi:DNA helicase [Paramicrobacterium chengjingii]|uniref:DNA helicase n=1 Tax=Paramicrobacterium chengjingii TaxID=2769067 RepID=A0ABX6YIN4_9MICO|nr:DNA helicase [Microbacterium chengjingii]QPZ38570.1 DNA helicase [Microbacterium chengjingii]